MELGAGTGQLSFLLRRWYSNIFSYMIDSSESACKYIREYFADKNLNEGQHYNISQFDIRELNDDMSFDLVMSSGLIEHFQGEEQKKIVEKHKRLSKKYVVIIVPYANLDNIKRAKTEKHMARYGYEKPMTEGELRDFFDNIEFEEVSTGIFYNQKLLIGIFERVK